MVNMERNMALESVKNHFATQASFSWSPVSLLRLLISKEIGK